MSFAFEHRLGLSLLAPLVCMVYTKEWQMGIDLVHGNCGVDKIPVNYAALNPSELAI